MKAIYLVRFGKPESAFEFREVELPVPGPHQIRIRSEAFGLNFADISARKGQYRDCPPLPAVLGYDLVGIVDAVGHQVKNLQAGDRVAALTRFGGYAEFSVTDCRAAVKIPEDLPLTFAGAIAVQYCTAWYASMDSIHLHAGDTALVHAAAGGVGTALVQLLRNQEVLVMGTCGADEKIKYLESIGVNHPINYRTTDYRKEVRKIMGSKGLDAVFDSLGGSYVRDGIRLLGPGGKLVSYGASTVMNAGFISRLIRIMQFGIYHPAFFLIHSKSLVGVSMLRLADAKPETVLRCMERVIENMQNGNIKPAGGSVFPVEELGLAHLAVESRTTMGKVMVKW